MSYHCDKLCSGECCAPLRSALEFAKQYCDPDETRWLVYQKNGWFLTRPWIVAPLDAIHNPAKLADLMAMGLRARGCAGRGFIDIVGDALVLRYWSEPRKRVKREFSLSEARAATLAIMALPSDASSKSQCERIIRGESCVH